jgi:hypothetical protein
MTRRELLARIDWRRDAVLWGRLLAVAVVVLGLIAVATDPWDIGDDFGNSTRARFSIGYSLHIVWLGSLILILTEVAARLQGDEGRPIWSVTSIVRAVAGAVIVVGCAVSIWNAIELGDAEESLIGNSFRHAVSSTIHPSLWQGGMLFILAAIADYTGWRDDEPAEEEEASIVLTEP